MQEQFDAMLKEAEEAYENDRGKGPIEKALRERLNLGAPSPDAEKRFFPSFTKPFYISTLFSGWKSDDRLLRESHPYPVLSHHGE